MLDVNIEKIMPRREPFTRDMNVVRASYARSLGMRSESREVDVLANLTQRHFRLLCPVKVQ
jgi:hypothetical protein